MNQSKQKVVQYLNEAHATEVGLVRVLQSQIAMTPRGSYRTALEKHLGETRDHAERVQARLAELGTGGNPALAAVGFIENAIGQTLALWKMPLDLLRGGSGEEKVLKNAKDTCATEALEIATYVALEQLARAVGDETTARLAASIRDDEEQMLERVRGELPKLAAAVVGAEIKGKPSYDLGKTGAADAVRAAGSQAKRSARQARKVPGVARAEGRVKGAVAAAEDLPIARYDDLTVDEISGRLADLSQVDLAKVEAYERKREGRTTILSRIDSLRGDEPWAGYDELTVDEIRAALTEAGDERTKRVRAYERSHKNRAGVLSVTERELASA
jgi:ferritin-like metal-binding protein YciE